MRAVIQRVLEAEVVVEGEVCGKINQGLLLFLGVHKEDTLEDLRYLTKKIAHLRIFCDEQGKMNLSLLDLGFEILVVSQFTLYGNCSEGRRPDFISCAEPSYAEGLYRESIRIFQEEYKLTTAQGKFGARMKVSLVNNGPVTFIIDTREQKRSL